MAYYRQGSREDRTQNEQNLPFLVLSVITYSLQDWLTHQRSITYPTHTAKLTETPFRFATRASHLSETTRSRDITCWGTFSGRPSWSSFLQTIVTSSSRKLVTGGPLVDSYRLFSQEDRTTEGNSWQHLWRYAFKRVHKLPKTSSPNQQKPTMYPLNCWASLLRAQPQCSLGVGKVSVLKDANTVFWTKKRDYPFLGQWYKHVHSHPWCGAYHTSLLDKYLWIPKNIKFVWARRKKKKEEA